jgi:sulfur relay (sulfurtransferase) DsrF/TusC family protein
MNSRGIQRLGLIIRSAPFTGRAARDQLDVALAAATVEYALELFFIGQGALQLVSRHEPAAACLPRGSRGWKSLPTLTEVNAWVEPGARAQFDTLGQPCLLDVAELDGPQMADRLQACDRVWVI